MLPIRIAAGRIAINNGNTVTLRIINARVIKAI